MLVYGLQMQNQRICKLILVYWNIRQAYIKIAMTYVLALLLISQQQTC